MVPTQESAIERSEGAAMHWFAVAVLAVFVMSIPSENGVTLPGVGSLSRLLGVVAFGVGIVALVRRGAIHFRFPSLFVLSALVFALWTMTTYFWSLFPAVTFGQFVTYAQLFVLAWLVSEFCRSSTETVILMQAFVLGSYVTIFVAFATFLSSPEPGFRDVGEFNANEFAIVSAVTIPMAWYLTVHLRSRLLVWLNLLYPLVAIAALVLAASRGGLLTGITALAVVPLTLHRLSVGQRLLVFALLAVTTWGLFAYVPRAFPELQRNVERLSTTGEELSEGTLTGRTTIWDAGIEVFLDSPVVGVGMGSFRYAVEPILGEVKAAHNAFLEAAVGGGLVGLLLFTALAATALTSVLLSERSSRPFLLVLFAATLVGMMPSNSTNAKFVWFIFSLLATQRPIILVSSGLGWDRTRSTHGPPTYGP